MEINEILQQLIQLNGSDLHISVGASPTFRVNGSLIQLQGDKVTPQTSLDLAKQLTNEEQFIKLTEVGDYDLSYSIPNVGRFRVSIFKQRGSYSIVVRSVQNIIPSLDELNMPPMLYEFTKKERGLILVTGPTGSGKTTTLASLIDVINKERKVHVITLEDPIEYLHKHNKSIVNQREYKTDFKTFANGLRSALRQDPDVILLGEMRDLETIEIALIAAETGHLVFSTLHTTGAARTIDRIIDAFPPHQQQQVLVQLANVLEGVISQQLLPDIQMGGRVPAVEIMVSTPAIKNLIREKKTHQIQNQIQTGSKFGMQSMDSSLLRLFKEKRISQQALFAAALDTEYVKVSL